MPKPQLRPRQIIIDVIPKDWTSAHDLSKIPKNRKVITWIKNDGVDSIDNMVSCLEDDKDTAREWDAIGTADKDGYAESVAYCHPLNMPMILSAPLGVEIAYQVLESFAVKKALKQYDDCKYCDPELRDLGLRARELIHDYEIGLRAAKKEHRRMVKADKEREKKNERSAGGHR